MNVAFHHRRIYPHLPSLGHPSLLRHLHHTLVQSLYDFRLDQLPQPRQRLGVRHFFIPDPGKGATILPPAFASGLECGFGDGVSLALRTPCPEVAHLPAAHPPGASTVPTTPRYPRLDLDATATVVDDVV